MEGKFTLTITLGNDAMTNVWHVGRALRDLADKMEANPQSDDGPILDANGNTVGVWRFDDLGDWGNR